REQTQTSPYRPLAHVVASWFHTDFKSIEIDELCSHLTGLPFHLEDDIILMDLTNHGDVRIVLELWRPESDS
ncbi:hypothetical protein DRQ53_09670, partial [bacterium]